MPEKKMASEVKKCSKLLESMKREIGKVVIGNEDVTESILRAVLCNSHVLLEGPSGVGKTLLIRSLQRIVKKAEYNRIQFTVDMLPSDVTGAEVYRRSKGTFEIQKGPVFANFVLADEINRSPPKVQSALLEAMEEREVTVGGKTLKLPSPFFVLATQNPQEEQGVFTLPEAQVDRFLFNTRMGYLERELEERVMEQNVEVKSIEEFGLKKVVGLGDILRMQSITKRVRLPDEVKEYAVKIVSASRYPKKYKYKLSEYVQWGGSPRATINLNIAGRANAVLEGRTCAEIRDIKKVSHDVLRHRIILSYRGRTQNVETDQIINSILEEVPTLF